MANELLDGSLSAQLSVIGSMLIDDRCVPLVLSKMRPDDFSDGTCKATYRAIQKLVLDGRPADPVTVVDAMSGGQSYVSWLRDVMESTPTAANVDEYMTIAQRGAALSQLRTYADKLLACVSLDDAQALVRKMSGLLSSTSRMPRMTGEELTKDFLARMSSQEKPQYLPWGIPTADSKVYTSLGDMILLGGYPSAGKTLLSILMALTQAKRYKVGYYTLETQPEKMADRMFAHLAGVPLSKIKTHSLDPDEWERIAEAASNYISACPFDIIRAAGSSVEDISLDAVGHGYQIIYVDYLQLIEAPGFRPGDNTARVSAVSRGLKVFAQRTNTAVVALAQLSRPEKTGKGEDRKPIPPSMQSFRDSGQIEQDADAAFLLWVEDPANNASRRILKLGKNKEGERFRVRLDFSGATQTMVEAPENVAAKYAAEGRAVKARNRAASQSKYTEAKGDDPDCPF